MGNSETASLLKDKIFKILTLLLLVRLGLYIPVPNIDLNIFSQNEITNSTLGFAKSLTGSSFLGIGSLGIIPYINASIIIQLLTSVIPSLEKLQKEEGEYGRQQITRYTRYLTFIWALVLSSGVAFLLIKPIVFDWSILLALKIILSLTTGSILSMWFAELITEEGLGNGSSMLIFINIVGGIPNSFKTFNQAIMDNTSYINNILAVGKLSIAYIFIVLVVVIFQYSYKKVDIVSAKQLNLNYSNENTQFSELKDSYIPLKLNQGGIMPLVFSSTIVVFLSYPLQILMGSDLGTKISFLPTLVSGFSILLNVILVIFFSCFYAILILKPEDISQNLAKMAYSIPGVRQGKKTTRHLERLVNRLAFMGGLFLAFLAFFPLFLGNLFQSSVFRNTTSLLILIGVITDVTSQVRGYLVSRRYEGFKRP
jgi:preprotein translocase subunit SecY